MGKRQVVKVLLACLGIVTILSLHGSPQVAQVFQQLNPAHNPVSTIQAFYKAVERGDWRQARTYTTWTCWNNLEGQGQIKAWQNSLAQDQSMEFAGFSIQNTRMEQKNAVIDGRAIWVSAQQIVPRFNQTITLEEDLGGWLISQIQTQTSAQLVEEFYNYMSNGQWDQAKMLVVPETWQALETNGTIAKLKQQFSKGPSLTAYIRNVDEGQNSARINADVIWLNNRELTVPADIQTIKTSKGWMIQRIVGGWPK